MPKINFKWSITTGVLLVVVAACLWIINDSKNSLTHKEIELQKAEQKIKEIAEQADQKIKGIQEQEKEVAELFEFLTDTQYASNAGETMLRDFNPGSISLDFTSYTYPSEKRIELVDTFVNYQKKYTKERLGHLYEKIEKKDGIAQHQQSIEFYLNFAVKIRDRVSDPKGIIKLETIKAKEQVQDTISATQKRIAILLQL